MTKTSPLIKPLALTMGEPGGVCAEISIKAWRALSNSGLCFFLIDDPKRLRSFGVPVRVINHVEEAADAFPSAIPVMEIGAAVSSTPGKADPSNARHVIASIERAVNFCLNGEASAVVTNPIQKASLIGSGFAFPGHTEFLAALTDSAPMIAPSSRRRGPVMMIAGPLLKTVPVTIHAPLRSAIDDLTTELIVEKSIVVAESLRFDFGMETPRLAISGLNPHAGESGALGNEDLSIIAPAINELRARDIDAVGPLPADTMFHAEARAEYDVAICMYHDQALIPVKTLNFHGAVNVTLGLPIIRTSPDHGTALDISGQNKARPDSLIAAIVMASEMAARRHR